MRNQCPGRQYIRLVLVITVVFLLISRCAAAPAKRTVVPLDGTWQIAQGGLTDDVPQVFDRSIPVPGLVDLAKPAFTEVGKPSPQRQAFWYRRTFTLTGPRSAATVALLKINKAMFGTKVWLNGTVIGEHFGCFTPGYFDASKALHWGAVNTLVVRVGCRDSAPAWLPTGTDYEKTMWQPGIYDSVSLTLTGDPYVSSVQIAPHIDSGTATIQVVLKNSQDRRIRTTLRLSVKEWKSGRAASTPVRLPVEIGGAGEHVATAQVRLRKPHLWSPEDPFLYVVRCETDTDAVETRFGLREFRYDPKTGRALLNGRPYYLRGTNFCMFRYFEDPLRGLLPWNRVWVRKLLTMPRNLFHWNSARVCIAPFPEFWYDIADETGWLLQDEYPIWGFHDQWGQDELKSEFQEWLRERWNHPSIAAWDACNETLTPRTGQLIREVRAMDLSSRPWDNGYSARDRPDDAMEIHPYTTTASATGENPRLGSPIEQGGPALGTQPVIINEYDAFWMCRDGFGTPWYGQWYKDMLGPDATLDQKRELQAYRGAMATEYWRARRQAAGVDWFCYLTYSVHGMVTSDDFADMPNLVLSPQFVNYMRDAFTPLAVMIDDTDARFAPGVKRVYRIIITNDLYERRSGVVRLTVTDRSGLKTFGHSSGKFSVKGLGQSTVNVSIVLPSGPGKYRLTAELFPSKGERVRSRRNLEVVTAEEAARLVSLGEHRQVTASSQLPGYPARSAVDGRGFTRWSSQFSDPQWIMIDLGKLRTVGRVVLDWEIAYGKSYRIQVSSDGRDWRDVYVTDQGKGRVEEVAFPAVQARYVRMYGTARGTEWGYSLWDLKVLEK